MTKEEKQILFKDLCARLPYGVMVRGVFLNYNKDLDRIQYEECDNRLEYRHLDRYEYLKPYLRPMSSMTEKEQKEFLELSDCMIDDWAIKPETCCYFMNKLADWLNAHHFDYRGLIPMGLALEAPKGMY